MPMHAIRLPDDARQLLKQEASRQGVTVSKFIRRAIAKALSESQLQVRPQ